MFTHSVALAALFLAFGLSAAAAREPVETAADTCRVLEAAYTSAVGSETPAYPRDIRASWRSLELNRFVPEYKARMELEPGEFEDLQARQAVSEVEAFRPQCRPKAVPSPWIDDEGHVMSISFTQPIVSTDGRLALVEVSFQEPGFGYGMLCVARRSGAAWSARCLDSWIT